MVLRMFRIEWLQVAWNRVVDSSGDAVTVEVRHEVVPVRYAHYVLVLGMTGSGAGCWCRDAIQVRERCVVEGCDSLAAGHPVRQMLQLDAAECTRDL